MNKDNIFERIVQITGIVSMSMWIFGIYLIFFGYNLSFMFGYWFNDLIYRCAFIIGISYIILYFVLRGKIAPKNGKLKKLSTVFLILDIIALLLVGSVFVIAAIFLSRMS